MYVNKNEKIRVKDTIIANIPVWFFYSVAVLFLILGLEAIKELDNQTNYLLGIIVICFATIRLLIIAGRPTIYLDDIKE